MAVKLTTANRTARADALITEIGNGAKVRLYSGTRPANVAAAITGTLLAELTGGSPFAPAASNGSFTANAITQDSAADAAGTATHFRIFKADGTTAVLDGDVTATGGGGELQLVTTTIALNQPVQVTSFVWTEGGA